jgi:hypothetical protein
MPYKDPEKRRESWRRYYNRNKKRLSNIGQKRKKKIREWLRNYKKSLKCQRCPETHPACLEFHHKDTDKKEQEINNMVKNGCSISKIKEEIAKCDVLCSNCHKKLHYVSTLNNQQN